MKKILINFILDESGSMGSMSDIVISGFNEYVNSLKPKGKSVRFTFTKFNSSKIDIVHNNIPVKDVALLTQSSFNPDGWTPLYDAIGRSIRSIEDELKNKVDSIDVLCVIMTDGQENFSKQYTRSKIFDMIKEKEKDGWTFLYMGTNQDVWGEGSKIGASVGNTYAYSNTSYGYASSFGVANVATNSYVARSLSTKSHVIADNICSDIDQDEVDKITQKIQDSVDKLNKKEKKEKWQIK